MIRSRSSVLLVGLLALAGCVRRDGRNADCKWPGETDPKTLSIVDSAAARHLRSDVEFAEELAIEYMDRHHGPRSGHFQSMQAAGQAMNACRTDLIGQIAKSHDVPGKTVASFAGRRDLAADAAITLPFLLLYGFLASVMTGWLLRRYPPADGWSAPLLMMAVCSFAFGIGGVLLGEQWSTVAENIRIGTGHLSYRLDRIPWTRYRTAFLVICFVSFWVIGLLRLGISGKQRLASRL